MKPFLTFGILAILLNVGCQDSDPLAQPFPKGFLWGTATAGFQVDMGCPSAPCLDTRSDWYQWVTTDITKADGLVNGDDLRRGPGHWELYETDFDLAKNELHNNAYRMSIEWSRLFPNSTTGADSADEVAALADDDAVAHYHAVFTALRERGITPLVTLNHYSLPLWLHDGAGCYKFVKDGGDAFDCPRNGWLDRETILSEIAKYSAFAAAEFGGEVDLWATMNEPYAVILAGYGIPTPRER
ncbi:MAG: glycoside hydrolase family 1 protein, partial [Candidatus Dadabacteria bacterium]